MSYVDIYRLWRASPFLSRSERAELEGACEDELKRAFGESLRFGTSGVRGIRGTGTGRINRFTVYRYCRAFAQVCAEKGGKRVLICRDCRKDGDIFLNAACQAFSQEGMEVSVLEGELAPTPLLSFAEERGGFDCAVNITSSHNTKEYSGIKMYGPGGELISDETARLTEQRAEKISVPCALEDFPRKTYVSFEEEYIRAVCPGIKYARGLKMAYTPLHGVSGRLFRLCAERCGIELLCVKEQMEPDGEFPTVSSPNPEDGEAMRLCIAEAERQGADIAVALDPDGDRMGAAVRTDEGFRKLNPNAAAALILDRQIRRGTPSGYRGSALITTYVSGGLPQALARHRGLEVRVTPTGFKNMAAERRKIESEGIFTALAFEEAFGYMLPGGARDKDGIAAALVLADEAGELKQKNGTGLWEVLEGLMKEVGYFDERWVSVPLGNIKGGQVFEEIAKAVSERFGTSETEVYRENLTVRAAFEGGLLWIRPSGTEPKIKLYGHGFGASFGEASANARKAADEGAVIINKCMGEWV